LERSKPINPKKPHPFFVLHSLYDALIDIIVMRLFEFSVLVGFEFVPSAGVSLGYEVVVKVMSEGAMTRLARHNQHRKPDKEQISLNHHIDTE
jgi:hypothetical protein